MTSGRTIAAGAGFAGDRIEPALYFAKSGLVDSIVLECLVERTMVPGLKARRTNPHAGADPRLQRRLKPLLPEAAANGCRVILSSDNKRILILPSESAHLRSVEPGSSDKTRAPREKPEIRDLRRRSRAPGADWRMRSVKWSP